MIAKKPKNSIITLIAVVLIAVITAVVCFSAQQPWLSSARKAELTEQWKAELRSRSPKDQEYYLNAATEFYGFGNRKTASAITEHTPANMVWKSTFCLFRVPSMMFRLRWRLPVNCLHTGLPFSYVVIIN